MFGSANRDEAIFQNPDYFDISRDNGPSISFGAGPHFCAGAWISKTLIAEVALPLFFSHFSNLYLKKPIEFQIRTQEMNQIAESGVAAHWLYKNKDIQLNDLQFQTHAWLQSLLDIQQQTGDSVEFLENIKVDLFYPKVKKYYSMLYNLSV